MCFFDPKIWIFGAKRQFFLMIAIFVDGTNDHYTRSSNFPIGTTPKKFSVSELGVIFLMARTIPPSFVEIGPKLRVVALLTWEWPKTAKNRGEPQKMTPSSETENFLGVVLMGKF